MNENISPRATVVTGGLGFIGLNLLEVLAEERVGETIFAIDKLGVGSNASIRPEALCLIRKVEDSAALLNTLAFRHKQVDVFHLAAESHVDRSISDPANFMLDNIHAAVAVLELARKHKNVRLLMVSTDEVYGDEGPFPTPWSMQLPTSSPYSASKGCADLMTYAYNRTYDLKIKLSRCCNNFGRYQHAEKFMPTIIRSILNGTPVPVYGDGTQMRQWVPAKVHAKRLSQLMDSEDTQMHVGGYSLTNLELIGKISEITEKETGKKAVLKHIADRPGHDRKYELSDNEAITESEFNQFLQDYVGSEIRRYDHE